MPDKLTKSFIDKIPYPDQGQVFYRDTELKGFGLRVGSGSKVYFAEGKIGRKNIRVTIGRHGLFAPEQARTEAKSILAMISRGIDPNDVDKARKAKSVTLAEVYKAYLVARRDLKPRTVYDYSRFMKTHFAEWNAKPITEISKDHIERKHRQIGEKSEAQANLAMRFLRALFNFAMAQYEDSNGTSIITDNPTKRLSQTRSWYRVERRQTVIKTHDLPVWLKTVHILPAISNGLNKEAVKDYLLLLIFTGLRREEGLALQWRDLEGSPFVFPGTGKKGYMDDPNKQMKIVIEASRVQFTPHDLRRTFITIAESLDIPAYALKRLINHKMRDDITAGYIIGDAERLRGPMQKICDYLMNLTLQAK